MAPWVVWVAGGYGSYRWFVYITTLLLREGHPGLILYCIVGHPNTASAPSTLLVLLEPHSLRYFLFIGLCKTEVGNKPRLMLRTKALPYTFLMAENEFECEADVIFWEYYRSNVDHTAFATVWRISSNGVFVIVAKTALPPTTIGLHRVPVKPPIKVVYSVYICIFEYFFYIKYFLLIQFIIYN